MVKVLSLEPKSAISHNIILTQGCVALVNKKDVNLGIIDIIGQNELIHSVNSGEYLEELNNVKYKNIEIHNHTNLSDFNKLERSRELLKVHHGKRSINRILPCLLWIKKFHSTYDPNLKIYVSHFPVTHQLISRLTNTLRVTITRGIHNYDDLVIREKRSISGFSNRIDEFF